MGFMKWHENIFMKIRPSFLQMAAFGKILSFMALGAIFSMQLVQYSYYLLILASLLLLYAITDILVLYRGKKKLSYEKILLTFIGLGLLFLFLGIQSPQLPYQLPLFIFGIVLALPASVDMFK